MQSNHQPQQGLSMTMMRYSFWHGHGCSVGDLTWLVQAFKLLKHNEWKPETPLYFDGSGWESSVREAAAISLLNALAVNETARTIYLQNADLDLKAQKALDSVFLQNKSLRKVSLKNLRCNDGPLAIPHAMFANKQLTELSISDCLIDDQGCSLLGGMINADSPLATLSLTKVTLSDAGMEGIIAGLASSRTLRTLNLRGLSLSADAKAKLLRGIGQNKSITSLALEEMRLDASSGIPLAAMLALNTELTTLSLRRNELTGETIRVLVDEGLTKNHMLRILKLSSNPVGDDGAKHLVDGLQHESSLERLCLIQAGIKRKGCVALCKGLASVKTLRHIALDGNEMEQCAPEALQLCQANVYIQSILEAPSYPTKHSGKTEIWKKVEMYLALNKVGRRVVREDNLSDGLLCRLLSTGSHQRDLIFELLKELPAYTRSGGKS